MAKGIAILCDQNADLVEILLGVAVTEINRHRRNQMLAR